MDNFAREIDRGLRRRGPDLLRKSGAVFLTLSLLLPVPAAHAAEFEISADSFTVVNQVNISSVTYFQTRAIVPPNPALATQLLTPGGLYFDATYYNVWDRTALAWVKLATGTVEAGRVAKSGDFMSGQLTTASTITVQGNAFSVGGSSFTVGGGSAAVAYQFSAGSFVGNGAGLTGVPGPANMATTDTAQTITGAKTLTQPLVLPADPTTALQAAPKQYVDSWTRPCVNPGNAADIMVPVGSWCVDKYETSVWSAATGGTQYGINGAADYPANCGNGLTGSGQGCTPGVAGSVTPTTPIYARSQVGVKPSTSLTWFQANVACGNAGKELLPNAVWQMAAAGTVDPGALAQDAGPACNTSGTQSMTTGNGTSCLSGYGVENMIGSVWEWVADWGTAGAGASNAFGTAVPWVSASYNGDQMWNIGGNAYNGSAWTAGQVPAVRRGGHWDNGAAAGVFAFDANIGPSSWYDYVGFRCGRRR